MKITAVLLKLGQKRVIISPMSPKITETKGTKHDGGEMGYFGIDGATKRGSSCQTHLAGECLGKQFDPRHSGCRLLRWAPRAD